MDIKHLKTFLTVNKLHSFSQAAKLLGYAQPTITTHIKALEDELHIKLFERLGHCITITQQGAYLLDYAEKIVNYSNEAIKFFSENIQEKDSLTIGANQSFSVIQLPVILRSFKEKYPSININLKFGTVDEIYSQIKENTIDIAFFLTRKLTYKDLIIKTLYKEQAFVFLPCHHHLANNKCLNLTDLQTETLIITQENCLYRTMITELLKNLNILPQSIIEINNIQAIKQLVQSNLGITILPYSSGQYELEHKQLTAIPIVNTSIDVYTQIAYHKDKWLSPTILKFLNEIKK